MKRLRILFVCTGNSARSQMAEAFARTLGFEAHSAGVNPAAQIHPVAVAVMAERNIDLTGHYPKIYEEDLARRMDIVVTVCGDAEERCPVLPAPVRRIHWPLPDPARAKGSPDEVAEVFRRVRDDIERRITELMDVREERG